MNIYISSIPNNHINIISNVWLWFNQHEHRMMFEDVSSSNGAMETVTRSTLPMDFGYWESLQVGGWILVRLSLSACRSSGMIVYKILAVLVIFPFLRRNRYIKSISWNAPPINSHHKDSIVVADASFGCSTDFFLCCYSCCCCSHFLAIRAAPCMEYLPIYTWKPIDLYKANVYR